MYNTDGLYITIINAKGIVQDAILTPFNNILISSSELFSNKIIVMSFNGLIIKEVSLDSPTYLSLSHDNSVYATSGSNVYKIAYETTLIFSFTSLSKCLQVIPVRAIYWTIESDASEIKPVIRIYCENSNKIDLCQFKVTIPTISKTIRLTYDGYNSMLLNDLVFKKVHIFSLNGDYCGQLLFHPPLQNLLSLTVDKQHHKLFVLQDREITVFALAYEE